MYKYERVIRTAVDLYGDESQLNVAIEELSELIKEICKHKRGEDNINAISEEMADVFIMLQQMLYIFDNEDKVKKWEFKKIERLVGRIEKENKDLGLTAIKMW